MAYKFTAEDFEIAEQMAASKEAPRKTDKATEFAEKIITGVESTAKPFARGVAQGAVNTGVSLANIIPGVNLPYQDFTPDDQGMLGNAMQFIGEFAAPGGAYAKGAKSLNKALGAPSIAKRAASGALAGAAVSGSEEPTSRVVGGVLGGAVPAAHGVSARGIGQSILGREKELEKTFARDYDNLFDAIKKEGLGNASIGAPKKLMSKTGQKGVREEITGKKDYLKSVSKFEKNPTFENAHRAQSDLNKLSMALERDLKATTARLGTAPSGKSDAIEYVNKWRSAIQDRMHKSLKDKGADDLSSAYKELGERYAKEMGPYKTSGVQKYKQGSIDSGKLLDELLGSPKNMFTGFGGKSGPEAWTARGGEYLNIPGMSTRRALRQSGVEPLLKAMLTSIALGGAAKTGLEMGIPGAGLLYKIKK